MARVLAVNRNFYAACAFGGVVLVGTWFFKLTRAEQDAVIAHEMGHAAHGDFFKRLWWLISFQWRGVEDRCKQQELQADAYATRQGHAAGLVKLLQRSKNHESPWHPDYHARILNIRNTLSDTAGDSPCL